MIDLQMSDSIFEYHSSFIVYNIDLKFYGYLCCLLMNVWRLKFSMRTIEQDKWIQTSNCIVPGQRNKINMYITGNMQLKKQFKKSH